MASITGDTLQEQIQKAISAHGVYKFKLAHMVEAETGEIQPPTASADYHCPVGQWLYETVPEAARQTEHYRTVQDLHARFHRAAGEVASLSLARRRTEALEAMELTSSFKKTSDQLVSAMEAWAAAVAVEGPGAGRLEEPAGAEVAAGSAAVPESQGDEPPPGWWHDSPTALAAEVDETQADEIQADEIQADEVEPDEFQAAAGGAAEEPVRAEEPQPAESSSSISDWFGLPKTRVGEAGETLPAEDDEQTQE